MVCGGGLTGVEAATEIAERFPGTDVTLLSRDRPGWMTSERARACLDRALDRLGVRARSGVEITKVLPDGGPPLFFRIAKHVDLPPAVPSARGGRANRNGGAGTTGTR